MEAAGKAKWERRAFCLTLAGTIGTWAFDHWHARQQLAAMRAEIAAHREDTQPLLKLVGQVEQFPAKDGYLSCRVKNTSTGQDAVLDSVYFEITCKDSLARINERYPYLDRGAPLPPAEEPRQKADAIELREGSWADNGKFFSFKADIDSSLSPGTAQRLRFRLGDIYCQHAEPQDLRLDGRIYICYDDRYIIVEDVSLHQRETPRIPNITPFRPRQEQHVASHR